MSTTRLEDTIAAVATPPGRGATALVRISGPAAADILRRVCPAVDRLPSPRLQHLLAVRHPENGALLDRALVSLFPAPSSYTGEDTLEISTHGGVLTPQLVLDAVYAAGARPAEPGEFTRRALLNGKLDLLQAEAVLDLIDGRSQALHRAAVHQMERGLSGRIEMLRTSLLDVEALMVYSIDFPEEDEPPVPPERILHEVGALVEQMDRLLETAPQGEMLREGALVVLAGRPNSGKSSLFNALLGTERAIVTEVPGTTRDALEASITVEGYPYRLVDTAGLRTTSDRVEEMGIEVARRYLRSAQIVLFCVEAGREIDPEEAQFLAELATGRTLLVRTKADRLPDATGEAHPHRQEAGSETLFVSAHAGTGLGELRQELLQRVFGGILGDPGEAPLVTRERHARALREARAEAVRVQHAVRNGLPMEFAATHVREAARVLEDLIGVMTPDDLLGHVFGQFCVGK